MSAPLRSPVGDGLPEPTIRTATLADLDALVALEHAAFATDRAERRAIRHAIRSPTMDVLAALIDAIIRVECGGMPYEPAVIDAGIQLSGIGAEA